MSPNPSRSLQSDSGCRAPRRRTAAELGITIPQSIPLQATEVIE